MKGYWTNVPPTMEGWYAVMYNTSSVEPVMVRVKLSTLGCPVVHVDAALHVDPRLIYRWWGEAYKLPQPPVE